MLEFKNYNLYILKLGQANEHCKMYSEHCKKENKNFREAILKLNHENKRQFENSN
jgi:hypothetical protein